MIGIDMKMPKSCRRCKLKAIEEDMCGDFFYYCPYWLHFLKMAKEKCLTETNLF